jgi:hypothetical protein
MDSRRPPEGAYLDRGCALSWLRLSAADQTETLRSRERGSKLLTHGPAVAWATELFRGVVEVEVGIRGASWDPRWVWGRLSRDREG